MYEVKDMKEDYKFDLNCLNGLYNEEISFLLHSNENLTELDKATINMHMLFIIFAKIEIAKLVAHIIMNALRENNNVEKNKATK